MRTSVATAISATSYGSNASYLPRAELLLTWLLGTGRCKLLRCCGRIEYITDSKLSLRASLHSLSVRGRLKSSSKIESVLWVFLTPY